MTPTIVVRKAKPYLVAGSPGGRTIPSTVLLTLLNVLDFGMNPQEAVDAPRFHHQWLPDRIRHERFGLSPDTVRALALKGHTLEEIRTQGVAELIRIDPEEGLLEGGVDRRAPDGGAIGR
jgi:gamma-glutamyltranspeptidase/glutathione hydrolase